MAGIRAYIGTRRLINEARWRSYMVEAAVWAAVREDDAYSVDAKPGQSERRTAQDVTGLRRLLDAIK